MISCTVIKEKVRKLKIIHGNHTVMEVIKFKNIVVCYLDENCDSSGAYKQYTDVQVIFINPKLNDYERRITYAHELGHAILHPDINTLDLNKYAPHFVKKFEKEADIFAAEFLLDNSIFERYHGCSEYEIAQREGVSVDYVRLKYNNLDECYKSRLSICV